MFAREGTPRRVLDKVFFHAPMKGSEPERCKVTARNGSGLASLEPMEISAVPPFAHLNPRLLVLRGVLSVAFAVLMFAWPGPGLLAIALLFGAYAFVDGVSAIATGVRRGRRGWVLPVLEGIAGIAAGVITALWPSITILVLSIFMGAWALTTGVLELVAAVSLADVMGRPVRGPRVLLAIAGALSIALGILIFARPAAGPIALLTFVGTYCFLFGIVLIALGARLSRAKRVEEPGEERPLKAA